MWDPDQLAEIPVLIDRLQAAGDPLGEWLAVRGRLDGEARVPASTRADLRRRARALRDQLGARLRLGADASSGSGDLDRGGYREHREHREHRDHREHDPHGGLGVHAVRERGLVIDASVVLGEGRADRLGTLLERPDTRLLLRLGVRADAPTLAGCVDVVLAASRGPAGAMPLRELELAVSQPPDTGPGEQASSAAVDACVAAVDQLAAALPQLYSLIIGGRTQPLPFDGSALTEVSSAEPRWSASRRTQLGRALSSAQATDRRRALEQLREHGVAANQLRTRLLAILADDPEDEVRRAAMAVIPRCGPGASALLAVASDLARDRDDRLLDEWLAATRSGRA